MSVSFTEVVCNRCVTTPHGGGREMADELILGGIDDSFSCEVVEREFSGLLAADERVF